MIEKKLKKAANKIKMSDELKSRIMAQCEKSTITESENEHVFVVEPVGRASILRIISGAAACAVLAAGVAASGYLVLRNSFPVDTVQDETADISTTENTFVQIAPFGDVSECSISLPSFPQMQTLPVEKCRQLAEFFNTQKS